MPPEEEDTAGPEEFIAKPSDDLPRNNLTDELTRGLQSYIQKKQKLSAFYVSVKPLECKSWTPAPRERAQLTNC